jgi:transcriptional regulator with XRE-family HTH domain
MAPESLGQQIRALRKKQGLTRGGLADRTCLSVLYIKKLELGERTSPSSETPERIARALWARATFFMDLNFPVSDPDASHVSTYRERRRRA